MKELLYTIEPQAGGGGTTIIIALIAALGGLAGMLALLRRPGTGGQRNQRLVGAMLLFFAFIIGGSTAFFSWLDLRRTGPVFIYRDAVETPFGKAAFRDISRVYIHLDQQPSRINPNQPRQQTRLLVIEERQGKTHVFSEERYDIAAMMERLKAAME